MINLLDQFLDQLEVRHSHLFTDSLYYEHPHRNNMYGLKKMLSIYGVKTLGVSIVSKDLSLLNYPCILHTHTDFAIGLACREDTVTYIMHDKKEETTVEKFKSIWTSYALVVEEQTDAHEPNYKKHLQEDFIENAKKYSVPLMLLMVVIFGIVSNHHVFDLYSTIGIALSTAGICVCALLLQKQIYGKSHLGDRVCSLLHHANCSSVLDGPNAKVFDISWSEIGMGYFITNVLLLSLYPNSCSSVAFVNWIAMLYGIWSIYYQWHIAKNWCLLCVTIQVIVWTMGLTATFFTLFKYNTIALIITCLVFAINIMVVHSFVSSYVSKKERIRITQRYRAIKANNTVAKSLIEQGDYYETTLKDSSILFGNPNASILVTIFSNPHCNPCARMHARVERLLASCNDDICVQYIFSSFYEKLEVSCRYLIYIYKNRTIEEAESLYSQWFFHDKFHHKSIIEKYLSYLNNIDIEKERNRHLEWRKRTGIMATPTVLVNGYILPDVFSIEDLSLLTECNITHSNKRMTEALSHRL